MTIKACWLKSNIATRGEPRYDTCLCTCTLPCYYFRTSKSFDSGVVESIMFYKEKRRSGKQYQLFFKENEI